MASNASLAAPATNPIVPIKCRNEEEGRQILDANAPLTYVYFPYGGEIDKIIKDKFEDCKTKIEKYCVFYRERTKPENISKRNIKIMVYKCGNIWLPSNITKNIYDRRPNKELFKDLTRVANLYIDINGQDGPINPATNMPRVFNSAPSPAAPRAPSPAAPRAPSPAAPGSVILNPKEFEENKRKALTMLNDCTDPAVLAAVIKAFEGGKQKYLKYKQKYLQLKKLLQNNN